MAKHGRLRLVWVCTSIIFLCGCQSEQTPKNAQVNVPIAKKVVEANPTAAKINVQLAVTYLQQGNVDRARQKLLIAEQQDPRSPIVLDAKAYFLEMTGEPGQAEGYYKEAIAVNPVNGDAQNNYGTYLCRQGRYKESVPRFLKAVQDPDYLSPAQAYENAGLCSLKVPDLKEAKFYFTRALQKEPSLPTSLLEMAQLSYDEGHFTRAQAFLSRYVHYNRPTSQSVWLHIQVAAKLSDNKSLESNVELLKNEFASSREYQEYLKNQSDYSHKL